MLLSRIVKLAFAASLAALPAQAIDFGDDASDYANDGACDDLRFEGKGMTGGPLLADDILHDATDCKRFYDAGKLTFSLEGEIDYGTDTSQWALDGECDDPRFDGPGMSDTPMLAEDIRQDASDCRSGFESGALWARGGPDAPEPDSGMDFGDDTSQWSNDGECDDPRFEGEGMTDTPLVEADIGHDATDCRAAFQAGRIKLTDTVPKDGAVVFENIDFGTDTSQWASDGECDDMRFQGEGMTDTPLLEEDIRKDASDCLTAFQEGRIALKTDTLTPDAPKAVVLDFGDDSSQWSGDGECDDPRFEGEGMTDTPLLDEDIGKDASDCRAQFEAAGIQLRQGVSGALDGQQTETSDAPARAFTFGDDSSQWARDGECDDPRFEGEGMTGTSLLDNDIERDASDCQAAFEAGTITLKAR